MKGSTAHVRVSLPPSLGSLVRCLTGWPRSLGCRSPLHKACPADLHMGVEARNQRPRTPPRCIASRCEMPGCCCPIEPIISEYTPLPFPPWSRSRNMPRSPLYLHTVLHIPLSENGPLKPFPSFLGPSALPPVPTSLQGSWPVSYLPPPLVESNACPHGGAWQRGSGPH